MAKRVLSLLLALVMALSLCVPAFAAEAPVDEADEVGAEAVEEVVDEAAAEPEAEPEVASVDEPATIATGEISPYAVEWLNDVLTKAAPFKARVDAGELYVYSASAAYVTKVTAGDKRADAFDKAYAEAERCQKAINGEETGADVTEKNVTDAADALEKLLPEDVTKQVEGQLTSKTVAAMDTALKASETTKGLAAFMGVTVSAALKESDIDALATSKSDDYVAALKAAFNAAADYTKKVAAGTATYADFTAVEKLVLAAKELAEDPVLTAADAAALKAAMDKVDAAKKAYDSETLKAKYKHWTDDTDEDETTVLGAYTKAGDMFADPGTTATGLKTNVTYAKYKAALTGMALVEIDYSVTVKLSVTAGMGITATLTKDADNKNAETKYFYSYTIGGKTLYATDSEDVLCDANKPLGGKSGDTDFGKFGEAKDGKQSATVVLKNAPTAPKTKQADVPAKFPANTTVAITVYVENETYKGKYDVVATDSITTPKDSYTGAKIALDEETGDPEVKVTYPAGSFTRDETDNMKLNGAVSKGDAISIEVSFDPSVTSAEEAVLALVGSNNSIVKDADGKEAKSAEAIKDTSTGSLPLADGKWEEKLTVSGMKIQLLTKGESGKEPVVHDGGEAAVEFDALSKWASFKDAKKYLEDAQDLSKVDYKLKPTGNGGFATIDDAWAQLQTNIDELAALIAAADSKVNSKYEQDLVLDAITKVATVYGYFDVNTDLDLVGIIDAISAAREAGNYTVSDIQNQDEDGNYVYTHASWAAFDKAYDAAVAVYKNGSPDATTKQSEIDKAAADLVAATEGLVKFGEADPTELKAAIAEAKALKEEDYTEESWAAADLDTVIAAAEAVANNENATQAQYDAALRSLEAAVAKLVEAEPEEPELEEGWNLIEGEYYYCKDGKMVKSDWVKSKGLWYHMGADGTMDTGFIHIVDDWGDGWYYLEPSNAKGTEGRMRTGWQEINDATAGHWGWFETRSNGHQGMCTYTTNQGDYKDYKPVK